MSKPVLEQRDRYNQRLTLHLEMANGELAQPMIYMKRLLKTQDLEAWKARAPRSKPCMISGVVNN